jgi:hypothetical protein
MTGHGTPDLKKQRTQESKRNVGDWHRIRFGANDTKLEQLGNGHAIISGDGLTARNESWGSHGWVSVRGNTSVTGGRWYYEVKLTGYGQVQIGWCTANWTYQVRKCRLARERESSGDKFFFCRSKQSQNGHAWRWDAIQAQKMTSAKDLSPFSTASCQHDVIGCGIDFESRTIHYWRNRQYLGVAFNGVTVKEHVMPLIVLSASASCVVNFGRTPFQSVADGFDRLYSTITNAEINQLSDLFEHYRSKKKKETTTTKIVVLSNLIPTLFFAEASEDDENESGSQSTKSTTIHDAGLELLQRDITSQLDENDPIMLMLFWKLSCKEKWQINRDEFMNGFTIQGYVVVVVVVVAVAAVVVVVDLRCLFLL